MNFIREPVTSPHGLGSQGSQGGLAGKSSSQVLDSEWRQTESNQVKIVRWLNGELWLDARYPQQVVGANWLCRLLSAYVAFLIDPFAPETPPRFRFIIREPGVNLPLAEIEKHENH
jgi:hypothetical protein